MSSIIYNLSLTGHIIGLSMLAGTTVVDLILVRQFWVQYHVDKTKGVLIHKAMSKYYALQPLGGAILILSGLVMMAYMHSVYGEQTWFRIKFALVIVIIINGIAVGRRHISRLRNLLNAETASAIPDIDMLTIKRNINLFHISQGTLLISVFVLSVFKFK